MSWFEFLLFAHIAMAVIWVGGALMMQFFGIRATRSADPSRLATLAEDIDWIAKRVFIPASLLAFLTGVLLVIESDFYGFGDDWIVIGLVLYATTFLAGALFLGPESGRIAKLVEAGSPEAGPRTLRLIMLSRLDNVVLWVLIYDMAVKPDFGDASSILWGVAGAAIAAGLVYWRYRVALGLPPGPGPAAGTPTAPG
jgi:uncharacterized membrane protein